MMKYLLMILVILSATSAFGQNAYGPDFLNLHCTAPDPNSNVLFNIPPRPGLVPNTSANGNMIVYCDSSSGALRTSVNGGAYISPGGIAPVFGNYTFSVSGSTVTAINNATGVVASSGSDLAVVFNAVTTAAATTGARLFFKTGVYPINSMTAETATGCSNFGGSGNLLAYGLALPANTTANSVQWLIEGESDSVWQGESLSTTINTNGVVFNVTPTAVSSAAANSVLAGIWQRPISNCSLTLATSVNNDLFIKNITIKFPTNQRGNEIAFAAYFVVDVQYENDLADFNLSYNTIGTGSAPVVGSYNSIGFTTAVSSSGNWMDFRNTYATGWNIGYDFQSEHVTGTTVTAIYCNIVAEFGRSATPVVHASKIIHFVDQESLHGIIFGPQMAVGSRVDLDLDMELGTSQWDARTTPNLVETNPGNTSGFIWYALDQQNTLGSISLAGSPLFTSGGNNFQTFSSSIPPNVAVIPAADTFTRANSGTLGSAWASFTFGGLFPLGITSNTAQINGTGQQAGISIYTAQAPTQDQFSKVTVNTIDSNANTLAAVYVRAAPGGSGPQTYYQYFCSHVAAGGSTLRKFTAGVITTFASQTSAVGCNAGDTIELRIIGSTLYALRNGVIDTNLSPNPTIDGSPLTGGFPGFSLAQDATGVISATNWSGGNLPVLYGASGGSLFSGPIAGSIYGTTTNCAAVGTAANPSVASCSAAPAGSFSCATNASTGTCTVNTTAVTANSEIFVTQRADTATGTRLGVTCNTTLSTVITQVSAVTAGTSFTINLGTITTNPECFSYFIVN